MRTGQYYLNKGGPYTEFFPEVLSLTAGKAVIDYAFHLAPMSEHIDEIPSLVAEHGVTSFKIFMFYGSHGLHGRSDDQWSFLMLPEDECYDYTRSSPSSTSSRVRTTRTRPSSSTCAC